MSDKKYKWDYKHKQVNELLTLCECDKWDDLANCTYRELYGEDCEYCQIAHDIAHFD